MIFVTVGTQLPFDRLIRTVDEWAANNQNVEVFAQIGPTKFRPSHIKSVDYISPDRAEDLFHSAKLIVSHAGIGSIITALKYKKQILILPRLAALGEHRNDHQLATARWLVNRAGISVAWHENDVKAYLDGRIQLSPAGAISENADPRFISKLRKEILKSLT